uniref:RNA helicase n=1 Tax=viral metagenome TaxID=1070528 RepID=A0A6C0F4L6_9ZZZZ|tara:strand:- start:8977 stop:10122 length:1146 start_codon:yes stop_codon:yes gene_type:complete
MENKSTFDNLNLNDKLLRGIYSYGFEVPSHIQYVAVPKFISGRDLIAQAQSGTGKTGAFSIGALQKLDPSIEGTQILIISPTRELALQTSEVIRQMGTYMESVTVMDVIGGTDINKCKTDLNSVPRIIIGTPGRILDMIQKKYLFTDKLHTLVFDEADEILSSGFKETIYNIVKVIPTNAQICLFSATMPDEVIELTNSFMNNPDSILVKKEALTLEGITQFFINTKMNDWKYDVLKDLYDTINIAQCIIYINSKQRLNDIHRALNDDNFPVSCIHGDMDASQRKVVMDDFKSGRTRILLSTDLLSRGIDIQQLSLVINYDLPKSKETYIHRIGRSGRYGRKGVAINLITDRDMDHLKDIEKHYETEIKEMPQNIEDYLSV